MRVLDRTGARFRSVVDSRGESYSDVILRLAEARPDAPRLVPVHKLYDFVGGFSGCAVTDN